MLNGVIWVVGVLLIRPDWPAALVWFAAQVLVPLGIPGDSRLRRFCPFAALSVGASLAFPQGMLAAGAALVWTLFASLLALETLLEQRFWPAENLSATAAPVYLMVGAGWLVASRGGFALFGFTGLIVLLTAAHFHYAGWALSTIASRLARKKPGPATRGAALAALAGMPLVAAGITFSPLLEWLGAWFMALAAGSVAFLQLERRPLPVLSSLCLLAGMGLAAWYARMEYLGLGDLAPMLRYHSTLNALGFAWLGLLASQDEGSMKVQGSAQSLQNRAV